MAVAFRQPTFKNPLPTIVNGTGKVLLGIFMTMVAFGESAGRARAASALAQQGFYKEAQALMTGKELS